MAIKSFVKIKPIKDDGPFSGSFNEIRKGINRTGAVTESIANNMVETHKLIRFEKEWLSERSEERVEKVVGEEVKEKNGFKKWLSNWTKMFRRKKRDQAEKLAEKGIEDGHKENEGLKEKAGAQGAGKVKAITSKGETEKGEMKRTDQWPGIEESEWPCRSELW